MKDFKNKKQQGIAQRNNSKQLPPPLRDSAEQKYASGIFLREVVQKGGGYNPSTRKAAFTLAGGRRPLLNSGYRRAAFTLAEVLITLAVIGIVAALTIPALIQNYKKTVTVSKLKKASAVLWQAYNRSIADYGDVAREGFEPFNPDDALEMFNKYYVPYIKFDKVEKGTKGVFGYMPDDTAFYFIKNAHPENWANTYITICTTHKACKNIDESALRGELFGLTNGVDRFGTYTSGHIPSYCFYDSTHAQRIAYCKAMRLEDCLALIWEAGWKIPDDYPHKF